MGLRSSSTSEYLRQKTLEVQTQYERDHHSHDSVLLVRLDPAVASMKNAAVAVAAVAVAAAREMTAGDPQ